jgi:hypothetical protein
MKISHFEVQVTSPEGVPFHEVLDPTTGEIYVVAEPGKRFELRYRVDPSYYCLPANNQYAIRAQIDGKRVGVARSFRVGFYEAKHVGFVLRGDTSGITYDLFKFASATANEEVEASSTEFQEGKIEVSFQHTKEVPGKNMYVAPNASVNQGPAVPSLPEGDLKIRKYKEPSQRPVPIHITHDFPSSFLFAYLKERNSS